MSAEHMPSVVRSLAALEEWLAADGDDRRILIVEQIPGHLAPWFVTARLGRLSNTHKGLTFADALAQAAQSVVSDPLLGGGDS